ncbi:GGDEF domain-containing protein [Garciella nitratireducens]|uniref:GGDEF domain-containing protein n=1 Tax=Garciella nitratireducens TaxID=218205 RepID=UPI001BD3D3C2|nr:GGDEF domain-containing protein [Garciella nitratireducens]
MNKKNAKIRQIIGIIINNKKEIVYSSIHHKKAYNLLVRLDVLNKLPKDFCIQYHHKNYWVIIDQFYIADQKYYVVIIDLSDFKCSRCNKVFIDLLTGLYNRNYWEQINNSSICNYFDIQNIFLGLIDIDNLKEINDTLGHIAGDRAIKIVGRAIQKSIRKEDIGIRYGGDEFLILFFNQKQKETEKAIQRIREEIKKIAKTQQMEIQISVGTASYDSFQNIEDTIKMADKELYKEKRKKNNESKKMKNKKSMR